MPLYYLSAFHQGCPRDMIVIECEQRAIAALGIRIHIFSSFYLRDIDNSASCVLGSLGMDLNAVSSREKNTFGFIWGCIIQVTIVQQAFFLDMGS